MAGPFREAKSKHADTLFAANRVISDEQRTALMQDAVALCAIDHPRKTCVEIGAEVDNAFAHGLRLARAMTERPCRSGG